MKKPIRLMQVTHDLAIGGLQQVVLSLCRNINREKFHVSVLCLRAIGPLAPEIEKLGIKIIALPQRPGKTDYFSFLKVARIFRQENVQVIHTHNTQPLLDGVMGALLSGVTRVVHTDHARQFPDKNRYMFMEWLMSHFVYKMVGVSKQTQQNLHKYEKIPSRKLMSIENGIDIQRFQIEIDVTLKKKELALPDKGQVIGVISRLEKVKGITYLLQAMPQIIERIPDITLLIVGDGSEMKQLKTQSKQIRIQDHVVFAGSRHDIPEILQVLDLFLLPSLSEGLPLGLLEAMAAGCPVLASKVGGIPSVIENGKNGLLISPGDPEAIRKGILRLLFDEQQRNRFSDTAFQIIAERFSAEQMSRNYEKLYGA